MSVFFRDSIYLSTWSYKFGSNTWNSSNLEKVRPQQNWGSFLCRRKGGRGGQYWLQSQEWFLQTVKAFLCPCFPIASHAHSSLFGSRHRVIKPHLSPTLLRPLCLLGRGINSKFSSLRKMDSDMSQVFQEELACIVCLNYLRDPVTTGSCHSFCWSWLCTSWEKAKSPAPCPVCREPSEQTNFKTNILLRNLVSNGRKVSLRLFLSSEHYRCGLHKETKQIFCEGDMSLLCVHCSSALEHEAHRHCPREKADEEHWVSAASESTMAAGGECSQDNIRTWESSWGLLNPLLTESQVPTELPVMGLWGKHSCIPAFIVVAFNGRVIK